jgi:transposase
MAEQIGMVDAIDALAGCDSRATLSLGQTVLAMCLNALGFTSKPLYMSPEFFKRRDLKFLLGKSRTKPELTLTPEHLNEHKLGRALDAIAELGPEKVFLAVSTRAFRKMGIKVPQLHLDTTTHSFYGQYEDEAGNPNPGTFTPADPEDDPTEVIITEGFSKDYKLHCKQIVQELLVSSDGDVPLLFKAHSGNASDVVIMKERLDNLKRCLKSVNSEDLMPEIVVADCKLYSKEALEFAASEKTTWVTRVPDTVSETGEHIAKAIRSRGHWKKCTHDAKISYQEFPVSKWGIDQRYIVVRTTGSRDRIEKAMPRRINKDKESLELKLRALRKISFACLPDLQTAVEKIFATSKFHSLTEFHYSEEESKRGRGRPRKDAPTGALIRTLWLEEVDFSEKKDAVRANELESACFVIATNALPENEKTEGENHRTECGSIRHKSTDNVLKAYLKDQQGVERSFRFLKDPQYFADAFFLKNPKRVVALLTVMTIALLLHALLQRTLRERIEITKRPVPDQKNRPTLRPTIRWVNQKFEGIDVIKVVVGTEIRYVYQALGEFVHVVLEILGPPYVERYTPSYLT